MKSSFSFLLKLRLPAVLAVCAALLLFLLDRASDDSALSSNSDESLLDSDLDYYVTDMITTRFDIDGRPAWRLLADRVTHYPDGDIAVLEAPQLAYYSDSSAPWQVTAAAGTLSPDAARGEDRLDLQGNVVLRQSAADGDFLQMSTPQMMVFPDAQEVTTAAEVVIETPHTSIEGTGMHATLEPQQISILSNVRGKHVQPALQP